MRFVETIRTAKRGPLLQVLNTGSHRQALEVTLSDRAGAIDVSALPTGADRAWGVVEELLRHLP